MKILGLDVGEKRIGTAVSDTLGSMAFPRYTIERDDLEGVMDSILSLSQLEGVERIVVGLPWSLDGTLNAQGHRILEFCDILSSRSPVPVETWDERFSTIEAEYLLRQRKVKTSREKGRIDSVAAAIILQRWLDHHREGRDSQGLIS